jgi:hypothetical protein
MDRNARGSPTFPAMSTSLTPDLCNGREGARVHEVRPDEEEGEGAAALAREANRVPPAEVDEGGHEGVPGELAEEEQQLWCCGKFNTNGQLLSLLDVQAFNKVRLYGNLLIQ